MSNKFEHVSTHYAVLYNERWAYPARGMCKDRAEAVSEFRYMVKSGMAGVELYEIRVFRNTVTAVVHEEMTKQWVSIKDCVPARTGKQHKKKKNTVKDETA